MRLTRKTEKIKGAVAQGDKGQQTHLGHHDEGGADQQIFTAENIGQSPGRHFGADDGDRPDGIEQGELLDGQAVSRERGW